MVELKSRVPVAPEREEDAAPRRFWREAISNVTSRKPLGAAGALIILLMIAMAALAPVIAPYNPVANVYEKIHQPPSVENWLGTDQFGRDILSRIIYGA